MKKDKFKNSFNNLFGEIEPIIHEEVKEEEPVEEIKEEIIEQKEEVKEDIKIVKTEEPVEEIKETTTEEEKIEPNRIKRNYYIPVDMLEEMKKVAYMDRELGGNYTKLVLEALRQYLDTKQDLIKEYDKLKDIK